MNTWRNLPGKIYVTLASLDPRLRTRSRRMAEVLTGDEAGLFLSMSRYDLVHSMAVASRLTGDDLLREAALLHDTGKLRSELGLLSRWHYTVLEMFYPSRLLRLSQRVEGEAAGSGVMERVHSLPRGWRRGLYVQLHHAEIAAELLERAGSKPEVIRLVRSHQDEPRDTMQRKLREADDSL
jgi:putative nucleotidyltransferase with HDIG domain